MKRLVSLSIAPSTRSNSNASPPMIVLCQRQLLTIAKIAESRCEIDQRLRHRCVRVERDFYCRDGPVFELEILGESRRPDRELLGAVIEELSVVLVAVQMQSTYGLCLVRENNKACRYEAPPNFACLMVDPDQRESRIRWTSISYFLGTLSKEGDIKCRDTSRLLGTSIIGEP